MTPENARQLKEEFPLFFKDPDFTFQCGDGWVNLLRCLLEAISIVIPEGLDVQQIKEKFGGLRFYYDARIDHDIRTRISVLIDQAESIADVVCSCCGKARLAGQYRCSIDGIHS